VGYVESRGTVRKYYKIVIRKPEGTRSIGKKLREYGTIILKWILNRV